MKNYNVIINKKIKPFNKIIAVDSDKSISIRSLLIGAISQNISTIKNILKSEDVMDTIKCLQKLEVKIVKKKSVISVYSKGIGSLYASKILN